MASGEQKKNHATASWIPTMTNCGDVHQFGAEDEESSFVDGVPLSPIPPTKGGTFGFSIDQFFSPFMSCVEPTLCSAPASQVGASSTFFCNRAMPEHRRPDVLKPQTVRRAVPNPNDVICGKGHNQSNHQGNRNLRDLIAANQEVYASLTKKEKQIMSKQIVGLILLHTEPTGRFLAWESASGMFVDVGLSRSIEKTNQGFRDALVKSNRQHSDDNRTMRNKRHQQTIVAIQIPHHLTTVYNNIPKPRDVFQYPDLVLALKSSMNVLPPGFELRQKTIPGPFSATNPNKPPAIVSPREYLPTAVRLAPRQSTTRKKLDFPPQLFTPIGFDDQSAGQERFSRADEVAKPIISMTPESPRRIHDWKRRRTGNDNDLNCSFESNNSLTEAIESRLTLQERVTPLPKMTKNLDMSADSTDGHAAFAATAFLRLDDSF